MGAHLRDVETHSGAVEAHLGAEEVVGGSHSGDDLWRITCYSEKSKNIKLKETWAIDKKKINTSAFLVSF